MGLEPTTCSLRVNGSAYLSYLGVNFVPLERRQAVGKLRLTAELVRARAWINGEGPHGFPDGPSFCGLDDRTSITETFARCLGFYSICNDESPLIWSFGHWKRDSDVRRGLLVMSQVRFYFSIPQ